MNTPYAHQLLVAVALFGLTGSAIAATPEPLPGNTPCHRLMTEQECGQFKTTLAQLSPGPALDRYLAEHLASMQEREGACSCNQKALAGTVYRQRKQAMLRL